MQEAFFIIIEKGEYNNANFKDSDCMVFIDDNICL